MISPARRAAFDVLLRVETAAAWASDTLLARARFLDTRDAGLAHEIVFGVLRRQSQCDFLISRFATGKLDPEVRIALRMGVYQLRHLDRVPAAAAVAQSVELVKAARKASAAGLVNAVLRKIPREHVDWPDRATSLAMPQWLLERWDSEFGPATAELIAREFLLRPARYVRGAVPGLTLEPAGLPGAFRVAGGDLRSVRLHDIGAQTIVPLLRLEPGQTFLDLCAAPGNKTAQALESGVKAVACDRYLHRLRAVQCRDRVVLDATRTLPFRTEFDRILVDAPCSGTGTLGRNPEIKWNLRSADIDDLHTRQAAILTRALALLPSGGRLVYSTCSLERRENEDVVASVRTGVRLVEEMRRTPGHDPGDGFYAAVLERN